MSVEATSYRYSTPYQLTKSDLIPTTFVTLLALSFITLGTLALLGSHQDLSIFHSLSSLGDPVSGALIASGGVILAGLTFYIIATCRAHRQEVESVSENDKINFCPIFKCLEEDRKRVRGDKCTLWQGEEDRAYLFSLRGEKREITIFRSDSQDVVDDYLMKQVDAMDHEGVGFTMVPKFHRGIDFEQILRKFTFNTTDEYPKLFEKYQSFMTDQFVRWREKGATQMQFIFQIQEGYFFVLEVKGEERKITMHIAERFHDLLPEYRDHLNAKFKEMRENHYTKRVSAEEPYRYSLSTVAGKILIMKLEMGTHLRTIWIYEEEQEEGWNSCLSDLFAHGGLMYPSTER